MQEQQNKNALTTGIDFRKHARIPVKWRVEISVDGKSYIAGLSENLSCSGIAVISPVSLKMNHKAHVKISGLVRGRKFVFDAIVIIRHVSLSGNEFRCGCEFIKIKDSVRAVITMLVDERLKANQTLQVA